MRKSFTKNQDKEKQYRIDYNFDGYGTAYIYATSEEEANEMFYDGNYEDQEESGDNYEISDTQVVAE